MIMQKTNSPLRLQKFLSSAGMASRRSAEKMIEEGRVRVNGKIVMEMGKKINPLKDLIEVDNTPVKLPLPKRSFLLYKPRGYLSTVTDPFGRPTVMNLFPSHLKKGLFPVGRLDLDTEGLLIMTNDGELAYFLTHPRFQIEKTYHAWVRGIPSKIELQTLREGFQAGDQTFSPARVTLLTSRTDPPEAKLKIVIAEGKKRQIKNMCKAVNHPVIFLKRVSLAFLNLKGLNPGTFRLLKKEEINKLYQMAQK